MNKACQKDDFIAKLVEDFKRMLNWCAKLIFYNWSKFVLDMHVKMAQRVWVQVQETWGVQKQPFMDLIFGLKIEPKL